jgi:transposase InsO family protein
VKEIRAILEEFPGYGHRRVTKEFHRRGVTVNKKRVQRLMQHYHLQRRPRRRFVRTTDSRHSLRVYPNLIRELVVDRPDQVWVADLTYVRLIHGFVFLAVILDLFSRKVIGWALSSRLKAELALQALQKALQTRSVSPGLIHHSDRGVQYASQDYVALLQHHGIQISMSRKGNPYDNATIESFFKTLKIEEVYLNEYADIGEAEQNIGAFVDEVYNIKRLHSSLGYRSPDEFEQSYNAHKAA